MTSKAVPPADASDEINWLTGRIIGAGIAVHRALGPGLLESAYEACLAAELRHVGHRVACQVAAPLIYRDVKLDVGYRMDMVVDGKVVVELKVADRLASVHVSQMLTYLKLSGLQAGLVLNFNVDALAGGGIKRVVRGGSIRRPSEPSRPSDPSASIG